MTVKELAKQMKKELNVLRKEFPGMSVRTETIDDDSVHFEIPLEHCGVKPKFSTVRFCVKKEPKGDNYNYRWTETEKFPCIISPGKYCWTTGKKYFARKDGTYNFNKIVEIIQEKLRERAADIESKIEEAKREKAQKKQLRGIKMPCDLKVKFYPDCDEYTLKIDRWGASHFTRDQVERICDIFNERKF